MTHPVDVHVGKRIRHRRWMVGMTQQQLAEKVGIKFQQIQKYETGMNRVSASRLWDIAETLSVPVSFLFEGLATEAEQEEQKQDADMRDIGQQRHVADPAQGERARQRANANVGDQQRLARVQRQRSNNRRAAEDYEQ